MKIYEQVQKIFGEKGFQKKRIFAAKNEIQGSERGNEVGAPKG